VNHPVSNPTPIPNPQLLEAKAAAQGVLVAADAFYDAHATNHPNMAAKRDAIAGAQADILTQVKRMRNAADALRDAR
jgi:hypothetical protein